MNFSTKEKTVNQYYKVIICILKYLEGSIPITVIYSETHKKLGGLVDGQSNEQMVRYVLNQTY